jgi:hypothetical protein
MYGTDEMLAMKIAAEILAEYPDINVSELSLVEVIKRSLRA